MPSSVFIFHSILESVLKLEGSCCLLTHPGHICEKGNREDFTFGIRPVFGSSF